ncbi:VOC family protein [Endozoicomonadaceae bacterium StTr2]
MNSVAIPNPLKSIHHITVEVDDLTVSKQFYREVLLLDDAPMPDGLREKGIHWFQLPGGQMLHLIQRRAKATETRAHVALAVENVLEWHHWLESRGATLETPKVKLYKVERLFLRDPSGNLIELLNPAGLL